jgi:hypothetical protein
MQGTAIFLQSARVALGVVGLAVFKDSGFRFDGPQPLWYQIGMPKTGEPRYDTCWRKSRIAARILLREEAGKLTPRDVALGHKLAEDRGVTPRLIDQAISGIRGKKFRLERERWKAA